MKLVGCRVDGANDHRSPKAGALVRGRCLTLPPVQSDGYKHCQNRVFSYVSALSQTEDNSLDSFVTQAREDPTNHRAKYSRRMLKRLRVAGSGKNNRHPKHYEQPSRGLCPLIAHAAWNPGCR